MNTFLDPDFQPALLSVRTDDIDAGTVRIAAVGEVDMASAGRLGDAIAQALVHRQPRRIVVDLAGVTFMDSSGLNVLVSCRGEAYAQGCELLLNSPAPAVHRILEVTGLLEIFGLPARRVEAAAG